MASIQTQYLKMRFFVFLFAVLLKVSTFTNAMPLADLCKLGGVSIEGLDFNNIDIPRLLLQAADTPKKSPVVKIKEAGEEVIGKMKEFYDLLVESQLIREEEEEIQHVDADNTDDLAVRGLESTNTSTEEESDPVKLAIQDEVRRKALRSTGSKFESANGTATDDETEPGKTAEVESESDKVESEAPLTEAEFVDSTASFESNDLTDESKTGLQNASEKFKQTAQNAAKNIQQWVDQSKIQVANVGGKIKEHTDRTTQNLRKFYNERIRAGKVDPKTGALVGGKEKKGFGKNFTQFIQDKVKNPLINFLKFKLKLIVDVQPLQG